MIELILATQNVDKVRELGHSLVGLPITVLGSADVGGWPEVDETGETLEANALLKAEAVVARFGKPALADDTGLEVDALDGAPGVYSARFAGPNATYADNVDALVSALDGVPEAERTAQFRCAIVVLDPDGRREVVVGEVQGCILEEPRGERGFGYDPVFFVPETGKTFAEMTIEEKRLVSHRGRALVKARAVLESWYC